MRPLLIITFLSVVLAGEPTSAQHYFTPPTSGQSYSSPGYGYFTPPAPQSTTEVRAGYRCKNSRTRNDDDK
jgi:hypothetical protein